MNKTINPFAYQRILETTMPNSTIPSWLGESYAQCYEDVIVDSMIRAYSKRLGRSFSLTYIEVGANHPACTSSSLLWQRKYGVTGILVEANPKLADNLKKFRPRDNVVNKAAVDSDISEIDFYISPENELSSLSKKFVETRENLGINLGIQEKIKVSTVRLNELLEMTKHHDVVILIIDVESLDLALIKDINFEKYRPLIIQAEPSDGFCPGTGNSMINFLKQKGYSLVAETDVNLIFMDSSRNIN